MNELYKSKLGDLKSKKEWLEWAYEFYREIGTSVPSNVFERVVKVLKLELVEDLAAEGEAQVKKYESKTYGRPPERAYDKFICASEYPEVNTNLERIEWFEE